MGSLRRFLVLPGADQRLIVKAAGVLAAIRLGLWVLSFRSVYRAVRAVSGRRRSPRGPDPSRIAWAVGVAGRILPENTCLVRALAAQVLLARRGHPSELRVGVASGSGRAFEAHAWLEWNGQVLIGGPVADRYVAFPALEDSGGPRRAGGPG
jgi:hypothetical protein